MPDTQLSQQDEVDAWNAAHRPGTLVHYWATDDRTDEPAADTTWTVAYLLQGRAAVRVTSGRFIPLAQVRPHPLATTIDGLTPVQPDHLDFPPPWCGYCDVDCDFDDDNWRCKECGARWSSNGTDGSRPCVECINEADVVGDDGQPRCKPCEANIRTGDLEPTAPYTCGRCREVVTGIGYQYGSARAAGRCGRCNHLH